MMLTRKRNGNVAVTGWIFRAAVLAGICALPVLAFAADPVAGTLQNGNTTQIQSSAAKMPHSSTRVHQTPNARVNQTGPAKPAASRPSTSVKAAYPAQSHPAKPVASAPTSPAKPAASAPKISPAQPAFSAQPQPVRPAAAAHTNPAKPAAAAPNSSAEKTSFSAPTHQAKPMSSAPALAEKPASANRANNPRPSFHAPKSAPAKPAASQTEVVPSASPSSKNLPQSSTLSDQISALKSELAQFKDSQVPSSKMKKQNTPQH